MPVREIGVSSAADYRTSNNVTAIARHAALRAGRDSTRAERRTGVAIRSRRVMRIAATLACCLAAAALPRDLQAGADPAPKDKGAKAVIRIAFAGDSIVDNYWEGILRVVSASPCLKTSVELGRFARNGTGLTRGDKLFWPREVRRIGETFRPDL